MAETDERAPKPFYLFLSGGGGVGETHTVNTIYDGLVCALRKPGQDPDKPVVLMTASTGKAASNINGTTLHSAFSLPIREKGKSFAFKKPGAEKLNTLRCMYVNLKVIVADEISMFGGSSLEHLHLSLQEIFQDSSQNHPFAGISVLAVGDLMQLNPVGDRAVFKENHQNDYTALAGSLWTNHFQLIELREIVRQKGDPVFAEELSRIRTGNMTHEDIGVLNQLENTDTSNFPIDTVHLYMTNQQVSVYNIEKLETLPQPHITIASVDSKRDLHTNIQSITIPPSSIYQTGGLPLQLTIAKGARVMLTKNCDIADHLVNGVIGTVVEFNIPANSPVNGHIIS
ncbi:hypothetical protein SNE40_014301 [Patella caerulea]|uniref:ATP-dependent DNA helicase n=1 Tax=Patella caerulea TaxID=87958 RepID=A0AAN8JHY1_PATCE